MKKIIKRAMLLCLLLTAILFVTSCDNETPYDQNDKDGYNVTIKYDAGAGAFTTNVSVITDSYKISDLTKDANGKVQLKLIDPADPVRGKANAYLAKNTGYFLAGWYTQRNEVTDGEGNTSYTYSGRWDFANDRLAIDPSEDHSSTKPITLYAAWIPQFKYEFCSFESGEVLSTYEFDPNYISNIDMPKWNLESGELEMGRFHKMNGMTLDKIYLDKEGLTEATGEVLEHTGSYDPETATASGAVMKVYLDYKEGEWYRISTAEQFVKLSSVGGCYEILADLDFATLPEEARWKSSLLYANFRGKIIGNNHTFKNIKAVQTDTSRAYFGLFGTLTDEAVIENLTFENLTVTIAGGSRAPDATFGLLAGFISENATLTGVAIKESVLEISTAANRENGLDIGVICGYGYRESMDLSGITCKMVGDDADSYTVTWKGNDVTITYAS